MFNSYLGIASGLILFEVGLDVWILPIVCQEYVKINQYHVLMLILLVLIVEGGGFSQEFCM